MDRSAKAQAAYGRAAAMLFNILESGRPLVYIRSAEEGRVAGLLRGASRQLGQSQPLPVWTWSLTEGLSPDKEQAGPGAERSGARVKDPEELLDFVAAHKEPAIFHLKDFHDPLRDSAAVRRRLRDLGQICFGRQTFIVITSPLRFIAEEIESSCAVIDLPPPDQAELVEFLRSEERETLAGASEEIFEQLARALQGVTLDEARSALRNALAAGRDSGIEALPGLLAENRLLINRGGVIERVGVSTNIAEVGGLEALKKWLMERRKLFQQRDALEADIVPKGVLVMGIPGCGKSLSVKAIASCFELPLYRINMTEIFSGRHGNPEGAFVAACHALEDLAPAVVWFDEIEMGVSSADTGEQGRMFAFFLTWMQERAAGLFVAATANRIDLLPAEMIRKGRFDEVFFVDLPQEDERIAIFKIHLSRRGVDPSRINLQQLMEFTRFWTGAEVEQCVISALTRARIEDREVADRDLVDVAIGVVPLARAMREQVNHIREWAFQRAVRASPVPVGN